MRPIPEFDGLFATEDGRVWDATLSRFRKLTVAHRKAGDYLVLKVTGVGTVYAHVLICLAWHGEAPAGKTQVSHVNGNSLDPRPSNLEWASQSDNEQRKKQHGRFNHDITAAQRLGNTHIGIKRLLEAM